MPLDLEKVKEHFFCENIHILYITQVLPIIFPHK